MTTATTSHKASHGVRVSPKKSSVKSPVEIRQTKMLIDGKWLDSSSGRTFETINPATGAVIAHVAEGEKPDIDKAVAAARRAFDKGPWSKMNARERGRLLYRLADLIEKNKVKEVRGGGAWRFRHLRLGGLAIFSYVGAEVAIGSIMISFLGQPSMGSMSHKDAARYVSLYWLCSMVGRFIGFFALQWIRAQRALAFVAAMAVLLTATAIVTHGGLALWALVSCGLFNSVMWPCIFPLSVKGLGRFTSQGSGILITMVVGGAVIPAVQGLLADAFGYQKSFLIVLMCYAYLLFFGVSGHRVHPVAEV